MSTAEIAPPTTPATDGSAIAGPAPVLVLRRRTIDSIGIAVGLVAVVVLAVAGGLLTWGNHFAGNYVHDELSSQHITFPTAEALTTEGRTDLLGWAGKKLDTGTGAQAYAGYINGHLAKIAAGATYADLGAPESAAKAAVASAKTAGASATDVAALQTTADGITNSRNTLFKGETLRGLLLTAYAWSTVGTIAGIAAIAAFVAAAVMAVLVGLGLVHHRRTPKIAAA